jgi:hypothetical protein
MTKKSGSGKMKVCKRWDPSVSFHCGLSYLLPFSAKEKKRSRFIEEWNGREKIMKEKNDKWSERNKHLEFDQLDTHRIETP